VHVPLNDHRPAIGPDTSPLEPTASDDEFLDPRAHVIFGRPRLPGATVTPTAPQQCGEN
jgi:hypothetical protein